MKDIVILYHADCPDGFTGAWAAWKKLGTKANYIPVEHQEPPPRGLKNKTIYFIDFTYSPVTTQKIIAANKKVIIIDHHLTAQPSVKLAQEYLYDIKHSGAALAWQYFHPKKKMPRLISYIEDRDLWCWRLLHTDEITSFIDLQDFSFSNWEKLAKIIENSNQRKRIIEKGGVIVAYRKHLVGRIAQKAEKVSFAGYKTLTVNAPHFLASELGHFLAKKMPPLSVTWEREGWKNEFSLRGNGKVNVGAIAKKFGGGGHKSAAGFALPANKPLPWKIIK